jgi:hypothetical protein
VSRGTPGSLLRALMPVAVTIVAAALLAACGLAGGPTGLLVGKVTPGPVSTVEQVGGPPDTRPYAATIDVETAGGDVVVVVKSGNDGVFSVRLKAGSYRLAPRTPQGRSFPRSASLNATVLADRTTKVTVTCDSGIR